MEDIFRFDADAEVDIELLKNKPQLKRKSSDDFELFESKHIGKQFELHEVDSSPYDRNRRPSMKDPPPLKLDQIQYGIEQEPSSTLKESAGFVTARSGETSKVGRGLESLARGQQEEQDLNTFFNEDRHLLVMTTAGKPVYSQ